MDSSLRNYLVVTGGYWAFTVTDGAIRMLVVLYFHLLGYSPFEVAMLFLFYEFFGIVTNLVGGWLGARIGLNLTMHIGMGMQVVALLMLTVPDVWLSVPYVMAAQALSGIAKDLNKMSAKASVKTLAGGGGESRLFKYVAVLTGSKNALKGAGFFIGAALLEWIGFRNTLFTLAGLLLLVLIVHHAAAAVGCRQDEVQAEIYRGLFQACRDQLALGGPVFPVRLARCLVRGRAAGVSVLGARLVVHPGGWFLRFLGDRLRYRAGIGT